MMKKYSLLTILTVLILVGFLATETNAQQGRRSKILGKTSDVTSKKKTGKKSAEIIINNSPKPPKKKGILQSLELEQEPEQSSRWELIGEIKVSGTETYPHPNGSCTKSIDRTYKIKVILDYMQQGFPVVTTPEELARISINLPKPTSVGNSRTMWMVSPLNPRATGSKSVHIKINDTNKCSYRASYGKPVETEDLWIFNDYLPSLDIGNTISLDKGQKTIYIGLQFSEGGKTVRHVSTMTGEPMKELTSPIPPHPQIEGVTYNVKLPATAAFLMNPNAGFEETFPTQEGDKVIAQKIYPKVAATYTFKKL